MAVSVGYRLGTSIARIKGYMSLSGVRRQLRGDQNQRWIATFRAIYRPPIPNEIVIEIAEAKHSRHRLYCQSSDPEINLFLTFTMSFADNISRMSEQPLRVEDLPGAPEGVCILRLSGPLTLPNLFGFQSKVRADNSRALILDFTDVPLADSAGIGALVGAYVSRQKDGRSLGLVGVNRRIYQALESTRVENFFRFFETVAEAEQAA